MMILDLHRQGLSVVSIALNSHAKCNAGIDRSCDGSEV
jgi:hypothetical protein